MSKYTVVIELNIEDPTFSTAEEASEWVNQYLDELGNVIVPYFETVSWPTCGWRIYENDIQVFPNN
jgi:hypothetical protein